jgi:hypothetical protein
LPRLEEFEKMWFECDIFFVYTKIATDIEDPFGQRSLSRSYLDEGLTVVAIIELGNSLYRAIEYLAIAKEVLSQWSTHG